MDKKTAVKLICDTFEQPFDEGRYANFVKNLLNTIDDSSPFTYQGNLIPDAYKQHITTLKRIGKYKDTNNSIDILIVHLKKDDSLERTRAMQRNFIAWYLNGSRGGELKDAALVAFRSPDDEDWRFSLVKMDYTLEETPQGKTKVKKELTPARRWSFLVGSHESSHTAQGQLVSILASDRQPLLSELENAFNIESVTKEFFNRYRELFHDIKDALDQLVSIDTVIRNDFESKRVTTVDFSKKLLGQIVFLYFLQKKGWFGVERDLPWGTGHRDFLRRLFDKKIVNYNNFFNDILEPLFYEALASDRTNSSDFYSRFNCKIPFLNGGLFDPIGGYSWVYTDILLPDELFSNRIKAKEGDIGTGILDVFDRYNFTVKEDEPLEKEVAIDPEMLGKVFENLLEVKDRKSKGTYYTPREIVHYMCQESLINYLDTSLNHAGVPLVQQSPPQGRLIGETIPEQGALKLPGQREIVKREEIEDFVKHGEAAVENDAQVVRKGKEIGRYSYKISVGVRNYSELIDSKLDEIRICDPAVGSGAFLVSMMTEIVRLRNILSTYISNKSGRSLYQFKRHAIQSCLYGVDIDQGAVEIAKLRLWLSLIVDEDDISQIQPLPNLDYKVVCGNSLLSVKRDMLNDALFRDLESLKVKYFDETSAKKKQEYKRKIDSIIAKITDNNRKFDFDIYFSEIFHNEIKRGFNVTVANPPYGIVFDSHLKDIFEREYQSFCRNNDIYVAFYEKGLSLLTTGGTLVFISPNTFLNGDYFKRLRKLLTSTVRINEVIDHKESFIFDDPTVFVCTLSCTKVTAMTFPYTYALKEAINRSGDYSLKTIVIDASSDRPFKPEDPVMSKILKRLDIDILDNLFFVKDVGLNYWTKGRGKIRGNSIGDKILYQGVMRNGKDVPFLKGRDIDRYYCGMPTNYLKHDYKKYLDDSVDTFRFSEEFFGIIPKIIYRQTSHKIIATIDESGRYLDKSVHLIVPKSKGTNINLLFLLALLNSRLFEYLYAYISQEKEGRTFAQVKATYVKQFPIVVVDSEKQSILIDIVDQILTMYKLEDSFSAQPTINKIEELKHTIDQIVYKLYGLTSDEIVIIEAGCKG